MNKVFYAALLIMGVIFISVGIILPGEQIVLAFIPPKGEAYLGKLLAGMWCFKIALITNGILAVVFQPLKRLLWDDAPFPVKLIRPFFKRPSPGPLLTSEWLILLCIIVLALVLRLIGSGQSLYGDEIIVQKMYISRGLPVIFTYFAYVPQHVLYSVIAWFFERLPLAIELSYRLPAILFGTGAAALTYLLARNVFDRLTAAITGILSSVAFYGIVYSQVAKGYSATHCMTLLALTAIVQIAADWRVTRGWWLFGTSLGVLAYVHLYNSYLCLALTLCVIFALLRSGEGVAAIKRLLLVLLILGSILFMLYSMQLPHILDQMARASSQPEQHLSLNFFHGWLAQLTFWSEYWVVALFCLAIVCAGIVALLRREPLFTALLLATPTLLMVQVLLLNSWIYPRYLVFTLPIFLIFFVEGARTIGRTAGVVVCTLVFLWPTTVVLGHYYQVGHQNIRAAAQMATGKPAFSYGPALDLFSFYNPNVKPVSTLTELSSMKGDYYLMYGWRKSWRGRENEFLYIDQNFTVVERFEGMTMDSFESDGEVVLMRSKN